MPGFLYFIETSKKSLTPADLKAVGLEYALTGEGLECRETTNGPGGAGGVVVVPQHASNPPTAAFKPDSQTWWAGPGKRYWVGMDKAGKPGPADLLRKQSYAGNPVRMRDGNDWVVPYAIALALGRKSTLPMIIGLAEDAETLVFNPDPQFQSLYDDAERIWEWMTGETELAYADLVPIAVRAMMCNYRVGKLEIVQCLQLMGEAEVNEVARAIVDMGAFEAHMVAERQKKIATTPVASNTNSGVTDATPTETKSV